MKTGLDIGKSSLLVIFGHSYFIIRWPVSYARDRTRATRSCLLLSYRWYVPSDEIHHLSSSSSFSKEHRTPLPLCHHFHSDIKYNLVRRRKRSKKEQKQWLLCGHNQGCGSKMGCLPNACHHRTTSATSLYPCLGR